MRNFRLIAVSPGTENRKWSVFNKEFAETIPVQPCFDRESKIFTMGSCFAVEIRKALRQRDVALFPQYDQLTFNPDRYLVGDLPDRDNINFYNTFSIEQEFAKAAGEWQQEADDFWQVPDSWWQSGEPAYQDPYRRCVFGRSLDDIQYTTEQLDTVIKQGIMAADGFLITLGLIEVWRKKDNGKIACMNPGYNLGGGKQETEFYLSSFADNVQNLERTIKHIRKLNSQAQIVFTVSPVPLGSTFTTNDVFVANQESKSVLRAAAAQVCREHDGVHYFQSYDICTAIKNIYQPDGRHVKPEVVNVVVQGFLASYFSF